MEVLSYLFLGAIVLAAGVILWSVLSEPKR